MKLKIKNGRILGIEEQELNPVLPTTDLSFMKDKDLYKEVRNYIKTEHRNLENKLFFKEGVVKGSSSYLAVVVDMYLKKHAPTHRIATQADLETNLQKFKNFYIDSGLALRSLDNPNSDKAKYLSEQLKTRGINNFPIWLDLRGLELDKNLNFNLTDESTYKIADCLNWENGTNYSKTDNFGLPKSKDKNSSRQIWTANNGLVRCFLIRNSNLNSRDGGLDNSYDYGRVVLVEARSAETRAKFKK